MSEMKYEDDDFSTDQWTTRDLLCLASAVLQSEDKNWLSVSRAVKSFGDPNRPSEWYTPKKCALQYSKLLKNVNDKKKTLSRAEQETPEELVVKHLADIRQRELESTVEQTRTLGVRLQSVIEKIESGYFDDQLDVIFNKVERDDKFFEEKYQEWISQKDASPVKKSNKFSSILTKGKSSAPKPDELNQQSSQLSEVSEEQVVSENQTYASKRKGDDMDLLHLVSSASRSSEAQVFASSNNPSFSMNVAFTQDKISSSDLSGSLSPVVSSIQMKNTPVGIVPCQINPRTVSSPQPFFNPNNLLANVATRLFPFSTASLTHGNTLCCSNPTSTTSSVPNLSVPSSVTLSAPTLSKLLEMPPSVPGKLPPLPTIFHKPDSVSLPVEPVTELLLKSQSSNNLVHVLGKSKDITSVQLMEYENASSTKNKPKPCEIIAPLIANLQNESEHSIEKRISDIIFSTKKAGVNESSESGAVNIGSVMSKTGVISDESNQLGLTGSQAINTNLNSIQHNSSVLSSGEFLLKESHHLMSETKKDFLGDNETVISRNEMTDKNESISDVSTVVNVQENSKKSSVIIPKQLKTDGTLMREEVLDETVNTFSLHTAESKSCVTAPMQNISEIFSEKHVKSEQHESSSPEKSVDCNEFVTSADNQSTPSKYVNKKNISSDVKCVNKEMTSEQNLEGLNPANVETSPFQTLSADMQCQSSTVEDDSLEINVKNKLNVQSPALMSPLRQALAVAVECKKGNISPADFQGMVSKTQEMNVSTKSANSYAGGDDSDHGRSRFSASLPTPPSSTLSYSLGTEIKQEPAVSHCESLISKSHPSSNLTSAKIGSNIESLISSPFSSQEKSPNQVVKMEIEVSEVTNDSAVTKVLENRKTCVLNSSSKDKDKFDECSLSSSASNENLDSSGDKDMSCEQKPDVNSISSKTKFSGVKRGKNEQSTFISQKGKGPNQATMKSPEALVEQSVGHIELNVTSKALKGSTTKIKSEEEVMQISVDETKPKMPFRHSVRRGERGRRNRGGGIFRKSVLDQKASLLSKSEVEEDGECVGGSEKYKRICVKVEKKETSHNTEDESATSSQDSEKGFSCDSRSSCHKGQDDQDKSDAEADSSEKKVSDVSDTCFLKALSTDTKTVDLNDSTSASPENTSVSESSFIKGKESKKQWSPQSIGPSSRSNLVTPTTTDYSDESDNSVDSDDSAEPGAKQPKLKWKDRDSQQRYKTWKKSISIVWREASHHKYASVFSQKVTDDVAPGYHGIVYRPMDLSLIKKNIDNGTIKTNEEFQRDMMLMFQNAIMYNSSDHDVYHMAVEMQRDVNKQIQDYLATQLIIQDKNNETSVSSSRNVRQIKTQSKTTQR